MKRSVKIVGPDISTAKNRKIGSGIQMHFHRKRGLFSKIKISGKTGGKDNNEKS